VAPSTKGEGETCHTGVTHLTPEEASHLW